MFAVLNRIFGLEAQSNPGTFRAALREAEAIPAQDKRRPVLRERALRELENMQYAADAVRDRVEAGFSGMRDREAEAAGKQAETWSALFAGVNLKRYADAVRLFSGLDAVVYVRPAGISGVGGRASDEKNLPAGYRSYIVAIPHHVVMAAAPDDMARMTKRYSLPKTATWLHGEREVRIYWTGSHTQPHFINPRFTAVFHYAYDGAEDARQFIDGAEWLVPPADVMPRGAFHLPALPPGIMEILGGTNDSATLAALFG